MSLNMYWKKRMLGSTITILTDDQPVGKLKTHPFKQKSIGTFHGKQYLFRTRGFLKQETVVTTPFANDPIATIRYGTWGNKATITYLDQSFEWKTFRKFLRDYRISNKDGLYLHFQGGANKGEISGTGELDFLVLAGLFVSNYFRESTMVILIAVFIPIFIVNISH